MISEHPQENPGPMLEFHYFIPEVIYTTYQCYTHEGGRARVGNL